MQYAIQTQLPVRFLEDRSGKLTQWVTEALIVDTFQEAETLRDIAIDKSSVMNTPVSIVEIVNRENGEVIDKWERPD